MLVIEQNVALALKLSEIPYVAETGLIVTSGSPRSWRPTTACARPTSLDAVAG